MADPQRVRALADGGVLEAAVKHHFDTLHAAGLSRPYDALGPRTRAVVAGQIRGSVEATIGATLDAIEEGR